MTLVLRYFQNQLNLYSNLFMFCHSTGKEGTQEQYSTYSTLIFVYQLSILFNQIDCTRHSVAAGKEQCSMRDPEDPYGPLVTSTDKTGRSPDPAFALVPAN